MNFENSVKLDPELTYRDMALMVYQGIQDGKLSQADTIELMDVHVREIYEPRSVRILAKAVGFLLDHKDKEGIFVEVDGKQWIVSIEEHKIKINGPTSYNAPDGNTVTIHNDEADGKIEAYLKGEKFIDELIIKP
jgi:hypothetical protein